MSVGGLTWRLLVAYAITNLIVVVLAACQYTDRLETKHRVETRCVESRLNREAIRQTLFDSLPQLGGRWDPKLRVVLPATDESKMIAYYRVHQAERRARLADVIRALSRFPEITCPSGD